MLLFATLRITSNTRGDIARCSGAETGTSGRYSGADIGGYSGADCGRYSGADIGRYSWADIGRYSGADIGGYSGADCGWYSGADLSSDDFTSDRHECRGRWHSDTGVSCDWRADAWRDVAQGWWTVAALLRAMSELRWRRRSVSSRRRCRDYRWHVPVHCEESGRRGKLWGQDRRVRCVFRSTSWNSASTWMMLFVCFVVPLRLSRWLFPSISHCQILHFTSIHVLTWTYLKGVECYLFWNGPDIVLACHLAQVPEHFGTILYCI